MSKLTTKQFILLEAFKLFTSKPYDQVTYSDVEAATKLSRGAILYHFKKKEIMFYAVIDEFIFKMNSIQKLSSAEDENLFDFIKRYIKISKEDKKKLKDLGIENLNLALLNIESQAFYYYPNMRELADKWLKFEFSMWKSKIANAMEKNELRSDLDPELIASIFENLYLGTSYCGIVEKRGYNIDLLHSQFLQLYEFIKN